MIPVLIELETWGKISQISLQKLKCKIQFLAEKKSSVSREKYVVDKPIKIDQETSFNSWKFQFSNIGETPKTLIEIMI